jgi:hypothetical protein
VKPAAEPAASDATEKAREDSDSTDKKPNE